MLERRVSGLPGVQRLSTDVVRQQLRVYYDAAVTSAAAIAEAVAETGMRAWLDRDVDSAPDERAGISQHPWLPAAAAAALVVGLAGHLAGWAESWTIGAMALAVLLGGVNTGRRALASLGQRRLDMYVLMLVAVIGAALVGEWVEAATVVVLFAVAQALERRSLDRARHAIRTLVAAQPSEVRIRRGTDVRSVPLGDVQVGDRLVVAPGERIAFDGTVESGASDVNQAPVTGESTPAGKLPGDRVFAGSINGHGALDVVVSAVGDDTTIARIIHLVERAQAQRAPSQAWVDRFARRYTPLVLALAAVVAFVAPLVFDGGFAAWGYRALVLLVIACPCALVLSTPISIVSALAAAARHGVLVKGGVHLERLATVRAVALDKTGTLTHGVLGVESVQPASGASLEDVLRAAGALGIRSTHPVDRAIARHAQQHGQALALVRDLRALPGQGIEGVVDGVPVLLGSRRLFEDRGLLDPALRARADALEARGMAVSFVGADGRALGVIGLTDELRVHGRDAIAALRKVGVAHVALLTGDHERSARAAGEAGQVDVVESGLLPQHKVALLQAMRQRHGSVVMVGDGVNDAPALAAADVGIAMGVAGSHAAIETADVALMSDDLRAVPFAIRLGRATLATIRANVAAALVIKLVFVSLAVAGAATLWMAVAADMGASFLVVANALRLLRVRFIEAVDAQSQGLQTNRARPAGRSRGRPHGTPGLSGGRPDLRVAEPRPDPGHGRADAGAAREVRP